MLLEVVARRLGDYCEVRGVLPEEESGFRPGCATTDMMFLVLRRRNWNGRQGDHLFSVSSTFRRRTTLLIALFCGRSLLALVFTHI